MPLPYPRARTAVSAAFLVNGAGFASWAPHVPAVRDRLGLDEGTLGLALLAASLGALVAMPLAGALADRAGSRRVVVAAGLGYAATLPLPLLADGFGALVAALFVWGALGGAMDVAMNVGAVAVERRLGRPVLSSVHAWWSVGGLAGAGAGGALLAGGVGPVAHLVGVALALAAVLALVAPALLPPDAERGARQPAEAGEPPPGALPLRQFLGGPLLVLGALAAVVMLAEGAMADWSAVYLRDRLRASPGGAATGYAAFALAMAAGRFGGDRVGGRVGRGVLLRAGAALAALGLAVVVAAPVAPLAVAGFGLVGLGLSNAIPSALAQAGAARPDAPGRALAAVTTVGYVGLLGGPPLVGVLAEALSLPAALGVVAGALALVALAAPRTRGR